MLVQQRDVRPTTEQIIKAWSLLGYRHRGTQTLLSRVVRLDLGEMHSLDGDNRDLVAFPRRDGQRHMELVSGYLSGSRSEQPSSVKATSRQIPLETDFEVTDVAWSGTTKKHYVLDAPSRQVLTVLRGHESVAVHRIPLQLPDDLPLGPGSRLAIVERDRDRPELLDPLIFISAPDARVVLSVDPRSGSAKVFAGQPLQAGKPLNGWTALASRFTHPTGLSVDLDSPEPRLLIADVATDEVYAIKIATGEVEVLLTSARSENRLAGRTPMWSVRGPLGMLVYRVESFQVDPHLLERTGAHLVPGWGEHPTLLICWDAANRLIILPLNLGNDPVDAAGLKQVRAVRPLPSGELIVIGSSVWNVQHPFALATPMMGMRTASSPAAPG